jgi:uncharacterized membrane protein YkgB
MIKLWSSLAVLSCTLIVSWIGALRYIPFRAEVSEMIKNESPYKEDRKLVAKVISDLEVATGNNTEAVQDLSRELLRNNLLLEQLIDSLEESR